MSQHSPLEAPFRRWNVLRILLHQVRSNAEHAVLNELGPVDGLHVEVEKLFVFVIEFRPKILEESNKVISKRTQVDISKSKLPSRCYC